MADKTVRGRFVWHELMTPDSAASQAFYAKVLGWKTQAWEQDPSYSMFAAASGPLGATVAESTQAPHWIAYIGTADIEEAVRQAQQLGANVIKDVTLIDTGGRYALLADPQGAKFGVYASDAPAQKEKAPQRGEFSWHELAAADAAAALDFYGQVFGWELIDKHDMGPMGFYYIFGRNGVPLGGAFDRTADMPGGPAWVGYVRVKDLDKAIQKVKSSGGTLLMGPMEVPGGDWIAQFADPHGALFSVHTLKADREQAKAAPAPAAAPEPAPAAAPAQKAAVASKPASRKPAAKSKAKTRPAAAKKKASKKKTAKKKTGKKKVAGKKVGKKKAGRKAARRTVAKSAKRSARKTAKGRAKAARKTQKRAGGKKKVAKARKKARRAK